MQMRAYLSITTGDVLEQNDATQMRFEPHPWIVNNGLTPAYDVKYNAAIETLTQPIAPTYEVQLPDVGL